MRLFLVIPFAVGCGASPSASSVCVAGKATTDATVFTRLTATSWLDFGRCGAGAPQPPTCNRLALVGDGSYHWTATSDYVERDQVGHWNFFARDASSGVVCLDDGSVVDFALTPTGLRWGPIGELGADARLSHTADRSALPAVDVSPLYMDLTEHGWDNTNEMDAFYLPSSFTLGMNGTFAAEFRDGACTTSGTFSLVGERGRFALWPQAEANVCDLRSGGTPASVPGAGSEPVIEAGVLRLASATYRNSDVVTDERSLAFETYGESGLLVSARWTGALQAGTTTAWAIEPRNVSSRMQKVLAMRIEVTPLVQTADGFSSTGPAQRLVDRTVGTLLLAGETLPLEASFALPAGWAAIRLAIDSEDDRQSYFNADSFIVELQ